MNIEKVGRRVVASQFEELFDAKTCVLGIWSNQRLEWVWWIFWRGMEGLQGDYWLVGQPIWTNSWKMYFFQGKTTLHSQII